MRALRLRGSGQLNALLYINVFETVTVDLVYLVPEAGDVSRSATGWPGAQPHFAHPN